MVKTRHQLNRNAGRLCCQQYPVRFSPVVTNKKEKSSTTDHLNHGRHLCMQQNGYSSPTQHAYHFGRGRGITCIPKDDSVSSFARKLCKIFVLSKTRNTPH